MGPPQFGKSSLDWRIGEFLKTLFPGIKKRINWLYSLKNDKEKNLFDPNGYWHDGDSWPLESEMIDVAATVKRAVCRCIAQMAEITREIELAKVINRRPMP